MQDEDFACGTCLAFCLLIGLAVGVYFLNRNRTFTKFFEDCADVLTSPLRQYIRVRLEEPYSNYNPKYYRIFGIQKTFVARSLAKGFKIEYRLNLHCFREDDEAFKKARMLDISSHYRIAEDYNEEIIKPFLKDNGYDFVFAWGRWREIGRVSPELIRTPLIKHIIEGGKERGRLTGGLTLATELRSKVLKRHGCSVKIISFETNFYSDEIVEENYAMLSEEEKKIAEEDPRYGALEEMVAVAALERRLDFIGRQACQKHQAEMLSVETEKVGSRVRISWKIRNAYSDSELVGFRSTEGFHPDEWDERANGRQIIHSAQDGEVVESLSDAEPYFYTLYIRSRTKSETGERRKDSLLRFQITVSDKEMTAIEAALTKAIPRRPADPSSKRSALIEGLEDVLQTREAFDAFEKSKIADIKKQGLPTAEEVAKIEEIRDFIRTRRSELDI